MNGQTWTKPHRNPKEAVAGMAAMALLCALIVAGAGFFIMVAANPWGWRASSPAVAINWIKLSLTAVGLLEAHPSWAEWLASLPLLSRVLISLQGGAIVAAILIGIVMGWRLTTPPPAVRHLRGRQLATGRRAERRAAKAMDKECQRLGEGIQIHPSLRISMERETRHVLVVGATGAGKTTILYPMMKEAIKRGDKALILDVKGDFTSCIDGLILAPWDERGISWDIAADVTSREDAETFAAAFIPESKDPMWSNGARQILVGVILYCIHANPGKWNIDSILEQCQKDLSDLRSIVQKHNPLAAAFMSEQSKTAQSFHVTLLTYLSTLVSLADGWRGKRPLSLRMWAFTPQEAMPGFAKVLLIQHNDRYAELSRQYSRCIIDILSSIINGPECPDSKERRIWFFLDEFAQLGRADKIRTFMEIGRSKGVRVVLGLQDVAQIEEQYSQSVKKIISSLVSTYIIGRVAGVETPKWLSSLIGRRTVERFCENVSQDYQRTSSWQQVEEDVITPSELSTMLGDVKGGISALLHTGGEEVWRLKWPHCEKAEIRPAVQLRRIREVRTATDAAALLGQDDSGPADGSSADQPSPAFSAPTKPKPETPEVEPVTTAAAALTLQDLLPSVLLAEPQEPQDETGEAGNHEDGPEVDPGQEAMSFLAEKVLDSVVPGAGLIINAVDVVDAAELITYSPIPNAKASSAPLAPRQPQDEAEEEGE